MVLEEATNSSSASPESFADNAYPSDGDPYSAYKNQNPQTRVIDLTGYPVPPALIGPLVFWPRSRLVSNVHDFVKAGEHILRRPLRDEEIHALAYHTLRANTTTANGSAMGGALALARCYQTRHEYRFPMWNPNTRLQDWTPDSLGPLKGQSARVAYQVLRIPAYWTVGVWMAGLVATSYAAVRATGNVGADERLKDLNAAIRELASKRKQPQPPAPPAGARAPAAAKQADDYNNGGAYDDMSPSTGAYSDTYSDSSARAEAETYQQRRQPAEQQQWQQQPQQQQQPRWGQEPPAHQQDPLWDDASPTGGLGPMDSAPSAAGGSAWDRVRQQAASSSSPARPASSAGAATPSPAWTRPTAQQREQRAGATLGDSFTFSKSDEERQLAKAEAQREFDERMEQERRGVDFNEGGKKW